MNVNLVSNISGGEKLFMLMTSREQANYVFIIVCQLAVTITDGLHIWRPILIGNVDSYGAYVGG